MFLFEILIELSRFIKQDSANADVCEGFVTAINGVAQHSGMVEPASRELSVKSHVSQLIEDIAQKTVLELNTWCTHFDRLYEMAAQNNARKILVFERVAPARKSTENTCGQAKKNVDELKIVRDGFYDRVEKLLGKYHLTGKDYAAHIGRNILDQDVNVECVAVYKAFAEIFYELCQTAITQLRGAKIGVKFENNIPEFVEIGITPLNSNDVIHFAILLIESVETGKRMQDEMWALPQKYLLPMVKDLEDKLSFGMQFMLYLLGKSNDQLIAKRKMPLELKKHRDDLKQIDGLIAETVKEIRGKISAGLTMPDLVSLGEYTMRQRTIWKIKQTYMNIANEINAAGKRIYAVIFAENVPLKFPVDNERKRK